MRLLCGAKQQLKASARTSGENEGDLSPSLSTRDIFTSARRLSFCPHYLNAWNNLASFLELTNWIVFPLQVNRSPSFGTDTKLDSEIKGGALFDTFNLLNIR